MQSAQPPPPTSSLSGDLWGGLAAMLVALPSSIAFGILVFSGLGDVGIGAMAGILGAAALGLVSALVGQTGGLISAPCAPAAAVLSALVVVLSGHGLKPPKVIALLVLTALLAACLQLLYGVIGGGRLIKFIPYPVVTGYLSGVGLLIALGQLPKFFGFPAHCSLLHGLLAPACWDWHCLLVGLVTMALMLGAPRITRKLPAPIFGLLGGICTYFALSAFSLALRQLGGNALLIGKIHMSGAVFLSGISNRAHALATIAPADISLILLSALTLSVLISIDTLKTCVGLETVTRNRHNADRVLVGQGLGNLASVLVGGMPGSGAMGPSLINVTSGGRSWRAGVIEGVLVIAALLFLSPLIAWIPFSALAGILFIVAFRMFDWHAVHLLRYQSGRQDFAVIAVVVLVSAFTDLMVAAGVGVALAILLFMRDHLRASVIRWKCYLNQISSKTLRLDSEKAILAQHGDQGVFCELQGDLFFGTSDQLYTQLDADLRSKKYLLFDMRHVQSMDYTAAHLFDLMHAQLAERGGQLLFSGMPSAVLDGRDFQRYLAEFDLLKSHGGVMISETLDGALEWIEEQILTEAGSHTGAPERRLELPDFARFHGFAAGILTQLAACVRERSVAAGESIIRHGETGDELFLVRQGSVRILQPLEGGQHHHLATIGAGNFFGELSFLDHGLRRSDVQAKSATELYVLSRSRLDAATKIDPTAGTQLFAHLAFAIAERLRQTDSDLQELEER